MKYLDKETLHAKAKELNVDIEGLAWPKQQALVFHAMQDAELAKPVPEPPKPLTPQEMMTDDERTRLEAMIERERRREVQVPVIKELGLNKPEPTLADYNNATVIISPGQTPTSNQVVKYDTVVGTQKETEDVYYGTGKYSPYSDLDQTDKTTTSTYRVTETGRPQHIQGTMPKYGCKITYKPTRDLVAIAEYAGQRGYLWKHHLPCIKDLLDQIGVYEKYKNLWYDQHHVFYLGGLICCDVAFTDEMIRRIAKTESKEQASA